MSDDEKTRRANAIKLLKRFLQEQTELEARIAKGEQRVAEILAATDSENPKFLEKKTLLDSLSEKLENIQVQLFNLWREFDFTVQFVTPKTAPIPVLFQESFNDDMQNATPTAREDEQNIYQWLTWQEYETLIFPTIASKEQWSAYCAAKGIPE